MKNSLLLKWLGKMMAYHFHESDQEMDWYAWGSLTLSVTIFMLVLLLPFSYFTFTHMKVDFDSKLDMWRSSMIVAAIVFAISGCVILLDQTMDQFGITDIASTAAIIAGQPLLKKRFITEGSSHGTSILSKYLSRRLGTLPTSMPTLIANSSRFGIAMTKDVGKFAARWIPFIGWGVLAYDVGSILYKTQVKFNQITEH